MGTVCKFLSLFVLPLMIASTISGCSGCGESYPDSPDKALSKIMTDLEAGTPETLWIALPPGYREDINGLVQLFATKMDADLWDKGFASLGRVTDVAKNKKEFILGSDMLSSYVADHTTEISENWDSVVAILHLFATGQLSKLDNLKTFDGGRFLSGTVKKMIKEGETLKDLKIFEEMMKTGDVPEKLSDYKYEILAIEDTTATLKLTTPNGHTEELVLKKVEDRWVPKEMADEWRTSIENARAQIEQIDDSFLQEHKPKVLATIAMVDSIAEQLQNAQTQEDFDKVLAGLMGGLF